MSDTPILPQTFPPPSRVDVFKGLVGDLARPFAVYVTFGATAVAIVRIAWVLSEHVNSWEGAAIFIGAVGALGGGVYGFKAWENTQASKHAADIAVAQTTSTGSTT